MNFTREPIIETVITPREGCKLVVRSSKGANQEDYFVDAVEVVSFGHSFFFRSLERPKSFLVPVSDYEILELKETRMVLKSVGTDRSIKIGGGREMPVRSHQRDRDELIESSIEEAPAAESAGSSHQTDRLDNKKRDRRRSRRRRGMGPSEQRSDMPMEAEEPLEQESSARGEKSEEQVAPSFISKLFPPPPTLIKETLSRYKTSDEGITVEETPQMPDELLDHPLPEPQSDSEDETKFED